MREAAQRGELGLTEDEIAFAEIAGRAADAYAAAIQ